MYRRTLAVTAAGLALAAGVVSAQCTVTLTGTGTYRLTVKSGGPVPVVEFEEATGPKWSINRRGSPARCDEAADAGTAKVTKSPNASVLLFHIANETRAAAEVEWAAGLRPTMDYPYRDFVTLADQVRSSMLIAGIRQVVARIARDLIKRYANPASYFTDKGAKWIAETAVELMIQEYVEGRDPGLIIDGLLSRMVDYLKSQAGTLTKKVGNPILQAELKKQLGAIAKDLKSLLVAQYPSEMWVLVETVEGDCSHSLRYSWDIKGGFYRAVLTIQCGPQRPDWVASVAVTAPPVKPGQAGTITVQAFNQLGIAFPLSDAKSAGLVAVMPDGSTEPRAVIAGRTATFNYTAARPRKDGTYTVHVTVTTGRSTGLLTGGTDATVVVQNVAPRILTVTPGAASAEPGADLEFRGARVLVEDDNADDRNQGEVRERSLRFEHPNGLQTAPLFQQPRNPKRVSFDGSSGRYVFEFDWTGRVATPHPHGTWAGRVIMADVDGEDATSSLNLDVENTPPVVAELQATPRFVHVGDKRVIAVRGRFTDRNGADDIADLVIDASDAGGARWTAANGLSRTGAGADWVTFEVTKPFVHTDVEGFHDITAEVRDETGSGDGKDVIHVGDLAPVISGTGYIWGDDPKPLDEDDLAVTAPTDLCPNDPFRVGMILTDPEGDSLKATATIVETRTTVELTNTNGSIWIADMRAPSVPGTYTLRFEGSEKAPGTLNASHEHTLVVHPCPSAKKDDTASMGTPVNPEDIASAPVDPLTQLFFGAFAGALVDAAVGTDAPADPALDDLYDEIDRTARGTSGPFVAGENAAQAPEVEAYMLALGNSTGPAVQFFGVNRSGRPVRLPAAALVLEPVQITPAAQARITSLLQAIIDRGGAPEIVSAYCLELLKKPPAAGMVLRIAGDALQQKFARYRRVLDSASRLRDLGRLSPDSDPRDYFHAIRQWAIWTTEERFDAKRFEDAFVERTRENYAEAGEAWTPDVESALRRLAPGRWADIRAVLREAGIETR